MRLRINFLAHPRDVIYSKKYITLHATWQFSVVNTTACREIQTACQRWTLLLATLDWRRISPLWLARWCVSTRTQGRYIGC